MEDKPDLKPTALHTARSFAEEIFGIQNLIALVPIDNYFRVVFKQETFTMQAGQTRPSKSQWNTLKKKMKRHNRMVFIFKNHGMIPRDNNDQKQSCCYIDFGFFRR